MRDYRIKKSTTIILTTVLISALVFPAINALAEDTAETATEALSSESAIATDSDTASCSEEVSYYTAATENGSAGDGSAVTGDDPDEEGTSGTEDDSAYEGTSGTEDDFANESTSGTEDDSVNESTSETEGDLAEESTDGITDGSVENNAAEKQSASDMVDELPASDVSSDETGKTSTTESEDASVNASLYSARGGSLKSSAPEKADYEGFEETGELSFFITNCEGIKLYSWLSAKDGIYYLFVTSGEDLSAMEIGFTGVKLYLSSNGTIDKKNFVITDAFSASGEMITLTGYDQREYRLKVMQSDLPNVMITLNGTDIDTVDSGSKDTKYSGNSILIINADGTVDLLQEDNVELKGRGNTTWVSAEKKPYQIKTNKKQSVLDMGKAKKWVLLANAFDDSLMRNKLMFDIAGQMGDWYVCDFEYVDLWIDGSYRGNYLIGEKCEIGDNRLDLSDENAVLMELDDAFYMWEDHSIYNETLGQHFAVADSVSDDADVIDAAMKSFNEKVTRLMNLLNYADLETLPLDAISALLDVEDAAKWYLINEFSGNMECQATSFFWYTDGDDDVLHLGPIWDFDSAFGHKDYYNPMLTNMHNTILFRGLLQCKSFRDTLNSIYSTYNGLFSGASSYAQTIKETIVNSAEMNYTRWDRLGKENEKYGDNPFAATFDQAVSWLTSWLDRRYASFDPCREEYYTYVKEGYIHIVYINNYIPSATFYIWSEENGQDDMQSLDAYRTADGRWTASVPLSAFRNDGKFNIHIYYGGLAYAWFQTIIETTPLIETALSGQNLEVTLRYHGSNLPVSAGIWSDANGLDDLAWYPMTKQTDGSYRTVVDLGTHKSPGMYNIHLYGRGAYIAGSSVVLDRCLSPSVTVSASADSPAVAEILAANLSGITNVKAAVWGDKNGQNDLKWYALNDRGDGTFAAAVDLTAHGESGTFNFHVYGNNGGINEFLDGKSISVSGEDVGIPDPSVDASVNGQSLSVVLNNAGEYPAVKAAVWSEENGQDDLAWYNMTKQNDGKFTLDTNLAKHKSSGTFIIHLYSGSSFVAGCTVQVDPPEPPYAEVMMLEKNMEIALYNADMYTSARAAVWSEENGQDDLAWYPMVKGSDGTYKVTVNPGLHKNTGRFIVHIYSGSTCLAGCIYEVSEMAVPVMEVSADPENNNKVIVSLDNAYGLENVKTAVWGSRNGQNDIKWYVLSADGDSTFRAEIDLSAHKETGEFYFHTYADNNGKTGFIDGSVFVFG